MAEFKITAAVSGVIVEHELYDSGIETIPLEYSYASEAALLRLERYLRADLISALSEEKAVAQFDQADPLSIIHLPWSRHRTMNEAVEYGRGVLRSLLATIGFTRGELGRPLCLIIEELKPPAASPTVHVVWEIPHYRGNFIRNAMSGTAHLFDTLSNTGSGALEFTYLFELFVDAKIEKNFHLSISKFWQLIENLACRSKEIRGTESAPYGLKWKDGPATGALKLVWDYANHINYIPIMIGSGELNLGECLIASYRIRNLTVHGASGHSSAPTEDAIVKKLENNLEIPNAFGMEHLCSCALRYEIMELRRQSEKP